MVRLKTYPAVSARDNLPVDHDGDVLAGLAAVAPHTTLVVDVVPGLRYVIMLPRYRYVIVLPRYIDTSKCFLDI